MQKLQTKQKLAISFGIGLTIVAVASVMLGMTFLSFATENVHTNEPTNGMPVPGSNVPEMIVSEGDSTISNGMPVPGSNVPEMIVSPN